MKQSNLYRWVNASDHSINGEFIVKNILTGKTKTAQYHYGWDKKSFLFKYPTAWEVLEEIEPVQEVKTPEQILRKYFKTVDNTDIHWMPEVFQAMEEYANQFKGLVPVS